MLAVAAVVVRFRERKTENEALMPEHEGLSEIPMGC